MQTGLVAPPVHWRPLSPAPTVADMSRHTQQAQLPLFPLDFPCALRFLLDSRWRGGTPHIVLNAWIHSGREPRTGDGRSDSSFTYKYLNLETLPVRPRTPLWHRHHPLRKRARHQRDTGGSPRLRGARLQGALRGCAGLAPAGTPSAVPAADRHPVHAASQTLCHRLETR